PSYSDTSELDVNKLSRDQEVVNQYANDPLILKKISAGLFSSIISASDWALKNASKLKIPTLLYHGTADEVISIEGSKQFAENSNNHLVFEQLEGVYHEPHNDISKEKVLSRIIEWVLQHLN
ncbi:MAG: alpha/beta hydrolase, partial [Bacteroidota bacterium]